MYARERGGAREIGVISVIGGMGGAGRGCGNIPIILIAPIIPIAYSTLLHKKKSVRKDTLFINICSTRNFVWREGFRLCIYTKRVSVEIPFYY